MLKYTKGFKRDAVRMCEREGVWESSEKLGVPMKALYTWRREERLERGEAPKGLRDGETPERCIKRLERENEELREANYIMKKPWVLWRADNRKDASGYIRLDP